MVAVLLVLSLGGTSAFAAGATRAPGRTLAVSVPPDPIPMTPGHSQRVLLRVVNPGPTRIQVKVQGRGLTLGNEGKVSFKDGPDPLWANRVDFPTKPFYVPAAGYKDLSVKVDVPKSLQPDFYFIGFLVTPIGKPDPGVSVVNQIGGFFTIDIPGPRDRRLTADLELPGWSFLGLRFYIGSDLNGVLHVRNVGHAAVRFWGETDTTATGGSTQQLRMPLSLLPSSLERSFAVESKPAWPIGFVHTRVQVVYPTKNDATTTEIVFTRSELVINPLVLVVLGILLLIVAWRVWLRRRHRKAALAPVRPRPAT